MGLQDGLGDMSRERGHNHYHTILMFLCVISYRHLHDNLDSRMVSLSFLESDSRERQHIKKTADLWCSLLSHRLICADAKLFVLFFLVILALARL